MLSLHNAKPGKDKKNVSHNPKKMSSGFFHKLTAVAYAYSPTIILLTAINNKKAIFLTG